MSPTSRPHLEIVRCLFECWLQDARRERRQQVAALSPRSAEDTRAKSTAAPSGQEPSGEESDEVQECESGSATKSAASPEAEKFIRAALDSGLATDGGCVLL